MKGTFSISLLFVVAVRRVIDWFTRFLMYRTRGAAECEGSSCSSLDSGVGESSCSGSSRFASTAAGAPTDFAAMVVAGCSDSDDTTSSRFINQNLNKEMSSMRIRQKSRLLIRAATMKEILALEEEDVSSLLDEDGDDDENARDFDTSFAKMPPPSLPFSSTNSAAAPTRIPFGDISNRLDSPVSTKRFARHATTGTLVSTSTGGLGNRHRKRVNCSPAQSPFGAQLCGKRWRVAEVASTSFAPRFGQHEDAEKDGTSTTRAVSPSQRGSFGRPSFHRVQSSSILEKGKYGHHDENMPAHLDVKYRLPIISKIDSQAYRRIDGATLATLMRTLGEEFSKRYALIDCRYPYEYNGGHIKGATNLFDPQLIEERFFTRETSLLEGEVQKRIPIFYCEFSQKRGPNMAAAVRATDRVRNSTNYPRVDHEEMYVLNGGYNEFHEKHGCPELCSVHSYTRMDDAAHIEELKKYRWHKKSASAVATVSRIAPPSSHLEKQARRLAQTESGSPRPLQRRASRRALYTDSPVAPPAPPATESMTSPSSAITCTTPNSNVMHTLPNPSFS